MSDYNNNEIEFEFDKELDIDVFFDFDVDVDIKIEKETDVKVEIKAETDVKGNSAELTYDVQAYGYDTYVQHDFVMLTVEDSLSSVAGYAVSAVG